MLGVIVVALVCIPVGSGVARAEGCRSLQKLKVSTANVVGGDVLTGTVVMACRLQRSAVVRLSASSGVRLPDSVTVRPRARTATFKIRTATTPTDRQAAITARFLGVRRVATFGLRAEPPQSPIVAAPVCVPVVDDLALPVGLHAGESGVGRVELSCVPTTAMSVALTTDQATVTIPGSVDLPAGSRSVDFPVGAADEYGASYTAHVTARLGTSAVSRTLGVTPGLHLVEIPASDDPNGVLLDVLFTGPLPSGGATVALSSSDAAIAVPPTATFPAGALGGSVPGIQVQRVAEPTPVTLTVTYGRRTLTASTTLVPPADPIAPTGLLRRSNAGEFVYGGQTMVQYDLRLDAPAPDGGLSVTYRIRDGDPAAKVEATSGWIGAGRTSDATVVSFADVSSTRTVVLEAVIGETVVELPITIQPRVTQIVVPGAGRGGEPFTGTVALAGPASVDTVVHLEASWSAVGVPSSITIPAGQTSATFEATTTPVAEDSEVYIVGYYGEQSGPHLQSNPLTLTP